MTAPRNRHLILDPRHSHRRHTRPSPGDLQDTPHQKHAVMFSATLGVERSGPFVATSAMRRSGFRSAAVAISKQEKRHRTNGVTNKRKNCGTRCQEVKITGKPTTTRKRCQRVFRVTRGAFCFGVRQPDGRDRGEGGAGGREFKKMCLVPPRFLPAIIRAGKIFFHMGLFSSFLTSFMISLWREGVAGSTAKPFQCIGLSGVVITLRPWKQSERRG